MAGPVFEGEFTGVIVLFVGGGGVVGIGVADKAVTKRIAPAVCHEADAVKQGLAGKAAPALGWPQSIRRQGVIPLLEAGEGVIGGQVF